MARKSIIEYNIGGQPCSTKLKGVDICSLNKRQQTALQEHSEHHTSKHIQAMVNSMNNGSSFSQSHEEAMKKVGK